MLYSSLCSYSSVVLDLNVHSQVQGTENYLNLSNVNPNIDIRLTSVMPILIIRYGIGNKTQHFYCGRHIK